MFNVVKLLDELIKTCMEQALKDNMTSIAFPALGCGNFKYDPRDVAGCFLRAEQTYGQRLQVRHGDR
jgi:hypothetical protein